MIWETNGPTRERTIVASFEDFSCHGVGWTRADKPLSERARARAMHSLLIVPRRHCNTGLRRACDCFGKLPTSMISGRASAIAVITWLRHSVKQVSTLWCRKAHFLSSPVEDDGGQGMPSSFAGN